MAQRRPQHRHNNIKADKKFNERNDYKIYLQLCGQLSDELLNTVRYPYTRLKKY